MYDQATPRRRSLLGTVAWVLAVVLSLSAVACTVWVLTRDLPDPQGGPERSTAEAASTPEPSQVRAPASPAPSATSSPPPPPPTPTIVALRAVASGRCLDVPGEAAADGTALQVYDCTGAAGQQWTASASGELRTLGTMCLDDTGGGQPDVPATIWTCHGGANQQWSPQADGTVRNVATGLCLDVSGGGTENGTPAIMYSCHAGDNQRWSTS